MRFHCWVRRLTFCLSSHTAGSANSAIWSHSTFELHAQRNWDGAHLREKPHVRLMPLFSHTCSLRGWVTGVTYPVSLTSSFCVPSLPSCLLLSMASISSSLSSSSSSAVLLWLRTKLKCSSAQTLVNGHINFVAYPSCFCCFLVCLSFCFTQLVWCFLSLCPSVIFSHFGWNTIISTSLPFILPLFTIWAQLCCVMVVHWLTYSLRSSPSPPLNSHCLSQGDQPYTGHAQ